MYELERTKRFSKDIEKLSVNEQRLVARKLRLLSENPHHPLLRTKKYTKYANTFESSVNMDIRILWQYKGDKIIIVIEIGHHDIL
jgi:mRNA-degrading endonuclease RelE of RelBE toxin-antitoxin system